VPQTDLPVDPDRDLVLVVEDNADMRAYIVALLAREYECLEAENGDEAVALAFEHVPDLVLCDIVLPGRDGFEVSHALKEDQRTSHVPIILLTARHDRDSRLHGWEEKVDGYLTKPFDDDELMLRVANLLDVREILKNRFASRFFENAVESNGMNPRDRVFMARLESVLEEGYGSESFGVERIAAGMFMSVRQVQRKLKALTGQTPSALLRAFRLRRARELLRTGLAVSQVSDATGFSSPAYFSTCFKAQFGVPPGEYQETNGAPSTNGT
jgi:CheY-like chemotaxis protein